MTVEIEFDFSEKISYVMFQNDMNVLLKATVTNGKTEAEDMIFKISSEPRFFEDTECRFDTVAPEEVIELADGKKMKIVLDTKYISSLTEKETSTVTFSVIQNGEVIGESSCKTQILPFDYWPGGTMADMIAAFVTPNASCMPMIRDKASQILKEWGESPSLEGYQGDRTRVLKMGAAFYAALESYNIRYVNPPTGFEEVGQRIRIPDDVLTNHEGTCIDLAVLYASALESIGINTVIFLMRGHAFAGFYLVDDSSPDIINYDSAAFTRMIRNNEMVAVECTMFTDGANGSFDNSRDKAILKLENSLEFVCALDVYRARKVIAPLPVRRQVNGEWIVEREERRHITSNPVSAGIVYGDVESKQLTTDDKWKRQLLDITNRNNLINMKTGTKVSPLLISDIGMFEDRFADGCEFRIFPRPQEWDGVGTYNARPFETENYVGNYKSMADVDLNRKLIRVPTTDMETEKTLRSIYRLSNKELDESGCNALFVAVGMLRWFEKDVSGVAHYAPLILIPAGLKKKQDGYALKKLDEETVFNVTLLEKLRQEFEINIPNMDPLPTDESGVNVDQILQVVRRSIGNKEGWEVLEGTALGVFSFSQYVMWKDLDSNIDKLRRCDVVDCLMDSKPYPSEKDLKEDSDPYGLCLTVPADGSQIKAVKAAGNGKTFVMHGPPGTGKSQTITNMITNALYMDKTVLFVAEKRAALEVVQSRLEDVGIGAHCLELHSNKSEKSKVLDQLRHALDRDKNFDEGKQKEVMERIQALRSRLDAYVTALHQEQPWGLSAYECISRYETHDVENVEEISLPVSTVRDMKRDEIPALEEAVRDAHRAYELTVGIESPAVRNVGLRDPRASVTDDARNHISECRTCSDELEKMIGTVKNMNLPVNPEDITGLRRFFAGIEKMDERMASDASLGNLPTQLEELLSGLKRTLLAFQDLNRTGIGTNVSSVQSYQTMITEVRSDLGASVSRGYMEEGTIFERMLNDLEDICTSFIRSIKDADTILKTWTTGVFDLNSQWDVASNWVAADSAKLFSKSKAKKEFLNRASPYLRDPKIKFDELSSTVNLVRAVSPEIVRIKDTVKTYAEDNLPIIQQKFSELNDKIVRANLVIQAARDLGINLQDLPATYSRVKASGDLPDRLENAAVEWENARNELNRGLVLHTPVENIPEFRKFDSEITPDMDQLFDWVNWNKYSGKLEDMGMFDTVERIRNGMDVNLLVNSVYRSLYKIMITICRQNSESLRMFSADNFEELISQFKKLDLTYTDYNKRLLKCKLSLRIPHNLDSSVPGTEASTLYRAVNGKNMRKSIRKLLSEIPNILPKICPCLLMSPQSVSQYLTNDFPDFDLVIFDESSQITTCKAIGALGRAKCAVIAGDSKQLPPTSFFQRKIETVEGDNDDMVDIDSFLDDCLALNMPETYLEWHYRSKHESLIAFSNRTFYDNKMLTFPSPNDQETCVRMVMTGGVYERGKRVNIIEAQAVVDEVYRRVMDPELRKQSIGIVAFSMSQQNCIQDLLDDRISKEPGFFSKFNEMPEEIFVKNLETVQGDERDVIMFSIGYGPTKDGTVYQNFGPINREGGGRRLNVVVSRARREMIVFSSMDFTAIKTTPTSSKGVRSLKEFLRFAENGGHFSDSDRTEPSESESSILKDIAAVLNENGYESHFGIGSSEFKVDVAVVNPECPDEYMLGILTDGESYRASTNTRDREYARADVLSRLGWNLIHIWSLEWYFNKKKTIENLLKVLDDIKSGITQCRIEPVQIEEPEDEEGPEETSGNMGTLMGAPEPVVNSNRMNYVLHEYPESLVPNAVERLPIVLENADMIIKDESPIDMSYLLKLLSKSLGIHRLSQKTRGPLERMLMQHLEWDGEDQFITFWDPEMDRESYKAYRVNNGDNKRDIEYISGPEIINAIVEVVRNSGSVQTENCAMAVGREFGFSRTGTNVKSRIEAALDIAVNKGLVDDDNGRITIPE